MSRQSARCRLEEMNIVSEKDLRLRDEPAHKVATVTEQKIGHLLVLALDRKGIVGTATSAQSQRKALHSGPLIVGK